MACPVCGKPSPCAHEQARTAVLIDPEVPDDSEDRFAESLEKPPDQRWRQEVSSRVMQHKARRRRQADPNALSFDFPAEPPYAVPVPETNQFISARPASSPEIIKIIQFPRPNVPPAYFSNRMAGIPDALELAEPVLDSPRILDAPEPVAEQMELLPTFADIELEAQQSPCGVEVELPPQPASLALRIFAGAVDLLVMAAAGAIFAGIFLAMSTGMPQTRPLLLAVAGAGAVLWAIYQYLFLAHSKGTPGMRLAQLEVCRFNGEPAPRSLRRWRALAGLLSGCSLGLGYLWAFVDEDTLGWHDRITGTCMKEVFSRTVPRE